MSGRLRDSDIKRVMRQMGIAPQQIEDAKEVIIVCDDREIIITAPNVIRLSVQGQTVYQIMGTENITRKSSDVPLNVNSEDVEFIATQAGVTPEKAKEALVKANGDVAQALIKLKNKEL